MDEDKRLRIYICLNELVRLAEIEAKDGTVRGRIHNLVCSPEYQEMKEWLKGKK
jgi:hypothetical protein